MTTDRELRVLVALDNALPNERALRLLTLLDRSAALALTGLFVEDEDLLRAATLPGLREISLTGQQLSLEPERIARDLAQAAASARKAFDDLASHLARSGDSLTGRFRHRFVVARGRISEEFHRAAERCDVVMVTRGLRATGLRPRQGRTFLTLVSQPKPVLIVNEPWDSGTSVVVVGNDQRALETAATLARADDLRLVVARLAGTTPPAGTPPEEAELHELEDLTEDTIARVCVDADARLLVVPAGTDLDWAELLVSLMDKVPCSLLKLAV